MKNKKFSSHKMNLLLIFSIILLISLLLIIVETIISMNVTRQQKETLDYSLWLSKNCICLEDNLISCPAGFKLIGKLCLDKENSTTPIVGCSKYNCSGEIKLFDVNLQKWQNQN
jgi:hypothetical protein